MSPSLTSLTIAPRNVGTNEGRRITHARIDAAAYRNKTFRGEPDKLKPGMHGDGGGLWLQVTPNGRIWIFRYTLNGRAREMGLGSLRTVGCQMRATRQENAASC